MIICLKEIINFTNLHSLLPFSFFSYHLYMYYLLYLQVKENFSRRTVTNIKLINQNFLETRSASVKIVLVRILLILSA